MKSYYRSLKNVIDTAYDEGIEEGMISGKMQGIIEVAKAMNAKRLSWDYIAELTGLSQVQIEAL